VIKLVRISVIIPTIRYGWLDILYNGFGNQQFKDFELIIIDDVPFDRSKEFEEYASKHGIITKYLKSKPPYWKANHMISNARNTGLIHADGELIVFIDDYTFVKPEFLQQHWDVYSKGQYTLVGQLIHVIYVPPQSRPKDLSVLPLNPERSGIDGAVRLWRDERANGGCRPCDGGWFWTSNASAPLYKIVEVNGFDEEYDGGTAGEDMDLGFRLERVGCRFLFDPACKTWHMHHDDPLLERPKPFPYITGKRVDSRDLLERNRNSPTPYVNKGIFDLRRERENVRVQGI